jgi:hypothetical protein
MTKKNNPHLTFHSQAEIQVQEGAPYRKEAKGTLMTFPMTKKNKKHTYFYNPSRNPGPGRCPLKKLSKRNVSDVPRTKKQRNLHSPFEIQVVQVHKAEFRSPCPCPSLRKKGVFFIFFLKKALN